MAKSELARILTIGRYALESDPVGTVDLRADGDVVELSVRLRLADLQGALHTTGLFLSDSQTRRAQRVNEAIEDAKTNLAEWQREWLTRTLMGDREIRKQTTDEFLLWAETRPDLDLWLGVPAVREKILEIQKTRDTATKRWLARTVAGIGSNRPQRLPDARVIYREVTEAETVLRPLRQQLANARNRVSVWLGLDPPVAKELERLKLRDWFSNDREAPTSWQMACELVAVKYEAQKSTIKKMAGRIREIRNNPFGLASKAQNQVIDAKFRSAFPRKRAKSKRAK